VKAFLLSLLMILCLAPGVAGAEERLPAGYVLDIALEGQNQQLLRSMEQRARQQLMLQETVEGLSVVAISYFTLIALLPYRWGPPDMRLLVPASLAYLVMGIWGFEYATRVRRLPVSLAYLLIESRAVRILERYRYFGINSADDLPKIREVLAEQLVSHTVMKDMEADEEIKSGDTEDSETPLAVADNGELIVNNEPGEGEEN